MPTKTTSVRFRPRHERLTRSQDRPKGCFLGAPSARCCRALRVLAICGGFLLPLSSGCAVTMAATQPPKRDVSVFLPGTPRGFVIAEVGQPVETEVIDGERIDTFVFRQGYSKEMRALRAMAHGAADLATMGLWEFAGTLFEAYADGHTVRLQVRYDGVGRVRLTEVYTGEKVMKTVIEGMPPPPAPEASSAHGL